MNFFYSGTRNNQLQHETLHVNGLVLAMVEVNDFDPVLLMSSISHTAVLLHYHLHIRYNRILSTLFTFGYEDIDHACHHAIVVTLHCVLESEWDLELVLHLSTAFYLRMATKLAYYSLRIYRLYP